MIAVDTNILVYAHQQQSAFHEAAYQTIQTLAEGSSAWGIPIACVSEFLSIVTNSKFSNQCSTYEQALAQMEAWLESPSLHLLHSGEQHWKHLSALTRSAKLQGGQFHDARIAAICLEHQVKVLYTADRDFGRFKTLKTLNPLV
jgi:toxin-antitoxin system PIN domain toxin